MSKARNSKTSENNPIPPEVRDPIVAVLGLLQERLRTENSATKKAADDASCSLWQLWAANPRDPWDDENEVMAILCGERGERPEIPAPSAEVRVKTLAAIDALRQFVTPDTKLAGSKTECIDRLRKVLARYPLITRASKDDREFLRAACIKPY